MATDTLIWIQGWYAAQCNEDWEHTYGICIENVDNPGWWVSIDLEETDLEEKRFTAVEVERSKLDWFFCHVEGRKFEGSGGPHNLEEILETFRHWVESNITDSLDSA
jgi:elongation factor P hydroxylase